MSRNTINRICYKYHLFLSLLSIVVGYGIIAWSMWESDNTIALNIFSIIVFWIFGTICFMILPLAILAVSILVRLFCFVPFIAGDYSYLSSILFGWSILNIISLTLSIKGYDSEEEIGCFIFN